MKTLFSSNSENEKVYHCHLFQNEWLWSHTYSYLYALTILIIVKNCSNPVSDRKVPPCLQSLIY